ncbi:MAG TPA: hypothetical protein VFV68_09290 [Agriterribacter sp.]|nr:hypothetical protein [Agriterribacter sp.]
MKKLTFLLLLAIPATCLCQSRVNQVIKVPGITLQQLIRGFLDAGYSIERSEASMSVIVTHLKEQKLNKVATKLIAKIKDGNVLLSGEYMIPGKDGIQVPITDAGTQGSACSASWDILQSFAKSFKKPLEFSDQ